MKNAATLLQSMASGRTVLGFFVLRTALYLTMLFYAIPEVEHCAAA